MEAKLLSHDRNYRENVRTPCQDIKVSSQVKRETC